MGKTNAIKRSALAALALVFALSLGGCAPKDVRINAAILGFDEIQPSAVPTSPAPLGDDTNKSTGHALITFVGDCTFSSIQGMSAFDEVYDSNGPAYFLSGVADVFAADDLTVINLEGPITTSDNQIDKGPANDDDGNPIAFWFKSPLEYTQILTSSSVEVCNLANNHSLDFGLEGFEETKRVLKDAGIDYFVYDDILVREVNGIKIGFFGFSFDSDPDNIHEIMDQLYAADAEVIVAYFHDGIEGYYYPNDSQVEAAYTAIDYGASAVIMSHPHVLQGTEEYNGGFIAYSLGNFCFGGNTNPDDKDCMMVQLEFSRESGGITCTPHVIPCSITSTPGTNDYRPMVLEGEEAQRVLDKIAEYSR